MWSRICRGAAVGLLCAAPVTLLAQTAPEPIVSKLSIDQLTERAALIVVTKVMSRRSEWEYSGGSRLIVTKVTLQVEQVAKGSASDTMTVEVLGGTIGEYTLAWIIHEYA